MLQTRRRILARGLGGAAAVGSVVGLAACGSLSRTAESPAASAGPATLRYTTEPGRVDSGVKEVVDAFNAKGTPVQVELEPVPGTFNEKMVALAAAGSPPDKEQKKTLLDSKESLEAIQVQADLTSKYGASPTDQEWQQFSSAPSASWGAAFSAGRAAMEIQPNDSLAPHIVPAPFNKGVAPLPKGRAGRVIRGLAVGVHILKGSPHQDAAWDFATFHSSKDAEKILVAKHTTLPWHKSTMDSLDKSMPLLPWENAAAYAEGLRRLRATPYVARFSDINKVYSGAYNPVRHGQKSAQQMMTEIKPQIEELLRG